jgi:hypothetical protein
MGTRFFEGAWPSAAGSLSYSIRPGRTTINEAARRIAVNIAKLPELLRKGLKKLSWERLRAFYGRAPAHRLGGPSPQTSSLPQRGQGSPSPEITTHFVRSRLPFNLPTTVLRTTLLTEKTNARKMRALARPNLGNGKSELGWHVTVSWQVAVDFETDADFNQNRRRPGHGVLLV